MSASYWDANASALTFTHPLELAWLSDLPKSARILDYGCGYGRTLAELWDAGWRNTLGVDVSSAMIARGKASHPSLNLRQFDPPRTDEPDQSFDAAILFAVLTVIPDDEGQAAVMAELRRLLKPGGLAYISDYPLQSNARYVERYRLGLERYGVHGVWTREDGGVFRHHPRERLRALLDGFDIAYERDIESTTMSGAPAIVTQLLGRRL